MPLVNVGVRLSEMARAMPDKVAVAVAAGRDAAGKRQYDSLTFRELDEDSNRLAAGLRELGVRPGMRIVLMVRPGIDFISFTFALFKLGAITVLIDPGMGFWNMLGCLGEVEPEGFVAISAVQSVRTLMFWQFPQARFNVTVGWRWFWGGPRVEDFRARVAADFEPAATGADDPAAIIFTTGSTGPAKGVLYRHGMFNRQVDEIRDHYGIGPGGTDLSCFPLFALFNAAMGTTTVIPEMDATRPAAVDPRNIVEAVRDWDANQAFGSPAVWNVVGRHCEETGVKLPTLRRVLSAGAPVPPHVLARMKAAIDPAGDIHTPYGATESLPVASISATEVLGETAAKTAAGAGTCVGRRFPGIEWRVIRHSDEPLATIAETEELPRGQIGEIIVRGPVVTREYVTGGGTAGGAARVNALHKIADGDTIWHRIGDLGYLDEQDRFWFCGRKAHRVRTADGEMYTEPVEAIFNTHPRVFRSALVGVGPAGKQTPVIVVELWPRPAGSPDDEGQIRRDLLTLAAAHDQTRAIRHVLFHPSLPVDIRHNAKIFREQLAPWAETHLPSFRRW
jgi:acyl-CoA synthetase (AMP-forming)/AMP-acid ligase II